MMPPRSLTSESSLPSAVASALLVLVISGCSDSGNDEVSSAAAAPPEAQAARPAVDEPPIAGEVVIDGQAHALTKSYWCEPEEGYESGTTVALRVYASDASDEVIVYGIQVDEDDGDTTSRISVATDPQTNYKSEGLDSEPTILMEGGAVRMQGYVYRPGRDPVEVEAEFSLAAQPGFPGYC